MTAVALPPAARRDPRIWWIGGFLVVVLLSALALYLDIPYLGSFVDWLVNRVPPLSYLIVAVRGPDRLRRAVRRHVRALRASPTSASRA